MPKRATHTFESEKDGVNEPQLGVQYCMCCGESVLILGPEVSLTDLPRRKVRGRELACFCHGPKRLPPRSVHHLHTQTDGAIVLERGVTVFKLKSKPTETKVLKRPGGYERQYRFGCWNCGVQLGYRAEDGGDSVALTYLLADGTGAQADLYLQMFQVPQCIQSTGPSSVRVALDVLVGQSKRLLRSIETDAVAVSVAAPAREGLANAELVDFMQKVLAVPRSQLQLSRGWSAASKFLMVTGVPAVQVFKRIKVQCLATHACFPPPPPVLPGLQVPPPMPAAVQLPRRPLSSYMHTHVHRHACIRMCMHACLLLPSGGNRG